MTPEQLESLRQALESPYTEYIDFCKRHMVDVCGSDPVVHDVFTANQALGSAFYEAAWSRRYYLHHSIKESVSKFKRP